MSLFSEMMRRKRAARESALQTVLTNVTCDTLPPPQLPAVNTPNAVALPGAGTRRRRRLLIRARPRNR